MTDFAERLYHKNRQPLHLVLDEADAFAPQRPMKGQERLLGAIEDLVRRGRARGIGVTLVTQRAAVLNKDVLTQAEVLVALRTIAPQDREAINAWIREADQLGRQLGKPFSLALDIGSARKRAANTEPTNPMHVRRLLRLGCQRRYQEAQGKSDEECHGAARHGGALKPKQKQFTCQGAWARV